MNKTYMTENTAYETALDSLAIMSDEACLISAEHDGALYTFEFVTEWLRYTCCVDVQTGEVVGVDCTPTAFGDMPEEETENAAERPAA